MNRQAEIKRIIDEGYKKGVFPLQTPSSLAKRWGVSTAFVQTRAARDLDFPKQTEGIIARMEKGGRTYALCDVKAYESKHGFGLNGVEE